MILHLLCRRKTRVVLTAVLAAFSAGVVDARQADPASTYRRMSGNVRVTQNGQVLLTADITLDRTQTVYLQSDGRFYPSHGRTQAAMYLTVDGRLTGNHSLIDWTVASTESPVQHSFNCIGLTTLPAGNHRVRLVARRFDRDFSVGSESNLCVLVSPAARAAANNGGRVRDIDVFTDNETRIDRLPTFTAASLRAPAGGNAVIALASGRCRTRNLRGPWGDAKYAIGLNGNMVSRAEQAMSVQDLFKGAEQEAPMFTHARFSANRISGDPTIELLATEFPWPVPPNIPQNLVFDSRWPYLVALCGPFGCNGHASTSRAGREYDFTDYLTVGGNQPNTPPLNQWNRIARGTIRIPTGHNGIVMVTGKARFQGDRRDAGGHGALRLRIDGRYVGSIGVQGLSNGHAVSQRTVGASFLTSGGAALSVGDHTVELMGRAAGDFRHLSVHREANLLWFD